MTSLIERIAKRNREENRIEKRLSENSLSSVGRLPKALAKGKSYGKLLNTIVDSNDNENRIAKRLEQKSYDAINGQRQAEPTGREGITMLGQLSREKPLEAISKEMIEKYQEEENKPFIIDGDARKYQKADYEPSFPVSFDELKSTDEIDGLISRYRKGRTDISNEIANFDSEIVEETVEFTNLVRSSSADNVTVWRNDQYQTQTSSSFGQFVDKKSISAYPVSQSLILQNNFQGTYSYINDVTSYEELWVESTLDSGTGFGIIYVDVLGSGSNYENISESVPHYTWMIPYSASVQEYNFMGTIDSYTKILNKLSIAKKDTYSAYPYEPATIFRGSTQNFLGTRHNPIRWDLSIAVSDDGVKYGYFVKSKQTTNYTVDSCGNPDKSLPVISTVVTNTSISTGNNGVLTVQ